MKAITIRMEHPCEGRAGELLEYSEALDRSEGRQATEVHLAACDRCSDFVRAIQAEQRLSRAVVFRTPGTRTGVAPVPRSLDDYKVWITSQAKWQSEQEIADTTVRLAKLLFHSDPAVSQVAMSNRLGRARDSVTRLRSLLDESARLGSRAHFTVFQGLLEIVSVFDEVQSRSLSQVHTRVETTRGLLSFAHQLRGGRCPAALFREALLEWFYGDEDRVPELLTLAEKHAYGEGLRADVLASMATWLAEHEGLEAALACNRDALRVRGEEDPLFIVPMVNNIVWEWLNGADASARKKMRFLTRAFPLSTIRARAPRQVHARVVNALCTIHGLPAGRGTRLLRAMDELLWRTRIEQ